MAQAATPAAILFVDKPGGVTSHDVVGRARRRLGTRRVGHAGTLDPMATGLLVLGVGPATRLLTFIVGLDKTYEATMRLGESMSTDDAEGESTGTFPVAFTDGQLAAGVELLTGELQQRPSSVSAIKVGGRRAHELARAGHAVDLPPRAITVRTFDLLAVRRSTDHVDIDVRVECSSGTYIRALARDLGASLGSGGHLTRLRRTRVGPFDIASADAVERAPLVAPAHVAGALFPTARLDEQRAWELAHGGRVTLPPGDEVPDDAEIVAAIGPDGALIGLVSLTGRVTKVLANFPAPAQGQEP